MDTQLSFSYFEVENSSYVIIVMGKVFKQKDPASFEPTTSRVGSHKCYRDTCKCETLKHSLQTCFTGSS